MVVLKTNYGEIKLELFADKAPKTVANFLSYVNSGFYNGTIFHRVIRGFMIQGGGFTKDMEQKDTNVPIINEADNGVLNEAFTVAMARTPDPHSATSQFFINVVDNDFLNFKSKDQEGYGYCVFGKVVSGKDTVLKIESVKTDNRRYAPHRDVPAEPVIIESAEVVED